MNIQFITAFLSGITAFLSGITAFLSGITAFLSGINDLKVSQLSTKYFVSSSFNVSSDREISDKDGHQSIGVRYGSIPQLGWLQVYTNHQS